MVGWAGSHVVVGGREGRNSVHASESRRYGGGRTRPSWLRRGRRPGDARAPEEVGRVALAPLHSLRLGVGEWYVVGSRSFRGTWAPTPPDPTGLDVGAGCAGPLTRMPPHTGCAGVPAGSHPEAARKGATKDTQSVGSGSRLGRRSAAAPSPAPNPQVRDGPSSSVRTGTVPHHGRAVDSLPSAPPPARRIVGPCGPWRYRGYVARPSDHARRKTNAIDRAQRWIGRSPKTWKAVQGVAGDPKPPLHESPVATPPANVPERVEHFSVRLAGQAHQRDVSAGAEAQSLDLNPRHANRPVAKDEGVGSRWHYATCSGGRNGEPYWPPLPMLRHCAVPHVSAPAPQPSDELTAYGPR